MIGRDWTHLGVAKLYRDIVANGYNIFYLTSRSVGQADTTRNYLSSIVQDGYKLPRGPVILSPDRTVAALRREVYLRKPEVFKMACLRDIMTLFNQRNPFYAGFGNRFTDALSYRSVNIPSNRIFTINSNAEVSLDLLTLSKYKSSYVSMQEILDHFFPPVGLLVASGGESYTDFNYWRDTPLELDEFSASDSDEGSEAGSAHHSVEEGSEVEEEEYDEEDEDEEIDESMRESFMSQDSLDEGADLIDSVNRHMARNERSSRDLGRSGSVSPSTSNRLAPRGRSPQRPTSR
jgi:phosphatidate phosphatase LPIN